MLSGDAAILKLKPTRMLGRVSPTATSMSMLSISESSRLGVVLAITVSSLNSVAGLRDFFRISSSDAFVAMR